MIVCGASGSGDNMEGTGRNNNVYDAGSKSNDDKKILSSNIQQKDTMCNVQVISNSQLPYFSTYTRRKTLPPELPCLLSMLPINKWELLTKCINNKMLDCDRFYVLNYIPLTEGFV